MSEMSEKANKLINDLRRDISIDIMFTPEKNAEDDSLKALMEYIAELEAERRWIPVREKPLELGTFLVLWKNGDIRKDWTYIDGGRYYWWNSGDQVTHYMPLPSFLELPNDTQTETFVYGKDSKQNE